MTQPQQQQQDYTPPEKGIALDPIDPKDVQQKQEQGEQKQGEQSQEQKQ